MNAFSSQLARWGQGLVRGCVQGGAVAAKAVVGTAALGAFGFPALMLSANQAAAVFLSGALYHLWDYLASNPLPDFGDDDPDELAQLKSDNLRLQGTLTMYKTALDHLKDDPSQHPAPIAAPGVETARNAENAK